MAAAHGGQVLLSDASHALVADKLPEGVHVRSLGGYRLKDIQQPERLHQLEIKGLPSSFPPLRALDVRRAHLPPEATTFIGRTEELAAIGDLLLDHRLVTLTGPGGTGKTRLAVRAAAQVADRFAEGAFFVALAATTDGALIPAAVTSAIGLPEDRERSIAEVLRDWLHEREVLLVLDNLEQIEDAAGAVDALLADAPRIRVLATSRAPLHVAGEQEFGVPPFSVPAADGGSGHARGRPTPSGYSSTGLGWCAPRSAQRRPISPSSRTSPGDSTGSPSRSSSLRPESACCRSQRFATAWHTVSTLLRSVRRQSRDASRASARRSPGATTCSTMPNAPCSGGWRHSSADGPTRRPTPSPATRRVGAVDTALELLADQSLIQALPAGEMPRFTMLATIGEFASELLTASDEETEIMRRHVAFFRAFAERARTESDGPTAGAWFDRIETDLDNFRAAIERAEAHGDIDSALAIAAGLGPFWLQRNHGAEGQRILVGLVDRAAPSDRPEFAIAAATAGYNAQWLGDHATGRRLGEVSAEAYRRVGDRRGLAFALGIVGFSTIEVDPLRSLELAEANLELYRELGDVLQQGRMLVGVATAQFALGRLSDARASLESSLDLARQAGDQFIPLFAGIFLARIKLLMGEIPERDRRLPGDARDSAGGRHADGDCLWARLLRRGGDLGGRCAPRRPSRSDLGTDQGGARRRCLGVDRRDARTARRGPGATLSS